MAFHRDPFPPSLPDFITPGMNSHLPALDGSNQAEFFESAFPFDTVEHALSNHELPDPAYRSHTSTEPNSGLSPMSTVFQDQGFSLSPESSPPDSSSGSSVQHQRKDSSNSSRSGLLGGDVAMVDESQVTAWSVAEGMAGIQSSSSINLGNNITSNTLDFNFSNSSMDKVFNFDNVVQSAASSPGPSTESIFAENIPIDDVTVLHRWSQEFIPPRGRAPGHRSAASAVSFSFLLCYNLSIWLLSFLEIWN